MRIQRRTRAIATTLVLCGLGQTVHAQGYGSVGCDQLWRERNGIYKSVGYCFQTQRARNYFGNAGCTTSNAAALPLSAAQHGQIAAIVRAERMKGCNEGSLDAGSGPRGRPPGGPNVGGNGGAGGNAPVIINGGTIYLSPQGGTGGGGGSVTRGR